MRTATRRRLSWGVGGLVLCLTAGVLAEAMPGSPEPGASARVAAVDLPVATASAPDAPPIDDWATTALGRPLFVPDRRPEAAAAAAGDSLPRLSGIIRLPSSSLAIFQPASGDGAGKSIMVSTGADLSGWTVASITDGDVTLVRDGQIATLHLSFANLPVAPHHLGKGAVEVLHDKRSNPFLQP